MNNIEDLKNKFRAQAKQKEIEMQFMYNKLHENQIRFVDCKDGHTYKIDGRNFDYAIFYNKLFYGFRVKLGGAFIDGEIHWDNDEHYGTARPQKELEKTPDEIIKALKYYIDNNINNEKMKDNIKKIRKYLHNLTLTE